MPNSPSLDAYFGHIAGQPGIESMLGQVVDALENRCDESTQSSEEIANDTVERIRIFLLSMPPEQVAAFEAINKEIADMDFGLSEEAVGPILSDNLKEVLFAVGGDIAKLKQILSAFREANLHVVAALFIWVLEQFGGIVAQVNDAIIPDHVARMMARLEQDNFDFDDLSLGDQITTRFLLGKKLGRLTPWETGIPLNGIFTGFRLTDVEVEDQHEKNSVRFTIVGSSGIPIHGSIRLLGLDAFDRLMHPLIAKSLEKWRVQSESFQQGERSDDSQPIQPDIEERSKTCSLSPRQQDVILLVHGIRTFASWQSMVKRVLEEIPNTTVIPIKYGYLDAFRFWCPIFTRQSAIDDLRREIQNARAEKPKSQISVIAHSFGTYAISQILVENPDITFHRLILSGSIIPRSYRWDYVRGRLGTDVLNDYGTRDVWSVLAKCLSWGFGDTGRHGFGRIGVTDRGHNYAHSDFFNEQFVREYWKPWFESDKIVPSPWEEKAPPPSSFLSVLSVVPIQWIFLLLLSAIVLWLGGKVVPSLEVIGGSGKAEIHPATPSDVKTPVKDLPPVQDLPTEELLQVVGDSQRDIASRSAALARLVKAKAIPDSAAMPLINSLIDEASGYWVIPEEARPKVDAAIAILGELAPNILVRPDNMTFVFQQVTDALNPDVVKNRDPQKAERRFELWFQFFRKGFFGQPHDSLEFLNDIKFLTSHIGTLDRLLVNLDHAQARSMIDSQLLGISLLGSLQVAKDDRLQKDVKLKSDATGVIQRILEHPVGANETYAISARVFDILSRPYGTFGSADKFIPISVRIVLNEQSYSQRSAVEHLIVDDSVRGESDRFYAASNYLKGACAAKMYSTDVEPVLRSFLEEQTQAIALLSPDKVERSNGDDRIRASLDVLFEMNDAMLGLKERGKPEGRLQPSTIEVIDKLLGLDPTLLENLNLGDARRRWHELKTVP